MLTYQECLKLISKAKFSTKTNTKAVKLENNTYLSQNKTGEFEVILHKTAILTLYPNGAYRLNTGGWQTVTTKARLNEYGPVRINQRQNKWFLDDGKEYQDGMLVKA